MVSFKLRFIFFVLATIPSTLSFSKIEYESDWDTAYKCGQHPVIIQCFLNTPAKERSSCFETESKSYCRYDSDNVQNVIDCLFSMRQILEYCGKAYNREIGEFHTAAKNLINVKAADKRDDAKDSLVDVRVALVEIKALLDSYKSQLDELNGLFVAHLKEYKFSTPGLLRNLQKEGASSVQKSLQEDSLDKLIAIKYEIIAKYENMDDLLFRKKHETNNLIGKYNALEEYIKSHLNDHKDVLEKNNIPLSSFELNTQVEQLNKVYNGYLSYIQKTASGKTAIIKQIDNRIELTIAKIVKAATKQTLETSEYLHEAAQFYAKISGTISAMIKENEYHQDLDLAFLSANFSAANDLLDYKGFCELPDDQIVPSYRSGCLLYKKNKPVAIRLTTTNVVKNIIFGLEVLEATSPSYKVAERQYLKEILKTPKYGEAVSLYDALLRGWSKQ